MLCLEGELAYIVESPELPGVRCLSMEDNLSVAILSSLLSSPQRCIEEG